MPPRIFTGRGSSTTAATSRKTKSMPCSAADLSSVRRAYHRKARQRRDGEGGDRRETERVGEMLPDIGHGHRRDRLHDQKRAANAADQAAIAGGAEQLERHGAARDGQKPVRHAVHYGEERSERGRKGKQRQQRESRDQKPDRKARDPQRVQSARERQFADPRQHLRRTEQHADGDDRRRRQSEPAENGEQLRG